MDRFLLTLEHNNPRFKEDQLTRVRLGKKPTGWYIAFLNSGPPEIFKGWELHSTYLFIVDDKYRYRK